MISSSLSTIGAINMDGDHSMSAREVILVIALGILSLPFASVRAGTGWTSLRVEGRLINTGEATKCLAQLRKPIWQEAAEDRIIGARFGVDFFYPSSDDGVIVSITCDGYQVYASKTISPGQHVLDIGTVDGLRRLDVDGCKELTGSEGEQAASKLISTFKSKGILPMDKVRFSRPRECKESIYMIFEAKDELNGPGQHWSVTKSKISGETTIEQGI